MVAKIKATKPRAPVWKRLVMIGGALLVVLVLVFGLLYFTNRPNYRDLEKEYERISAYIPADWQLVSKSSNKGTWGLFCLGVDDSSCPYITQEYSVSNNIGDEANAIISSLQKIVVDSGFTLNTESQHKCDNNFLANKDYSCSAIGYRGKIEFYVDLTSSNSYGKTGSWASFRLSRYEE